MKVLSIEGIGPTNEQPLTRDDMVSLEPTYLQPLVKWLMGLRFATRNPEIVAVMNLRKAHSATNRPTVRTHVGRFDVEVAPDILVPANSDLGFWLVGNEPRYIRLPLAYKMYTSLLTSLHENRPKPLERMLRRDLASTLKYHREKFQRQSKLCGGAYDALVTPKRRS